MDNIVLSWPALEMLLAVYISQHYDGILESVEQKSIQVFILFQQLKYWMQSMIVHNFLMFRKVK